MRQRPGSRPTSMRAMMISGKIHSFVLRSDAVRGKQAHNELGICEGGAHIRGPVLSTADAVRLVPPSGRYRRAGAAASPYGWVGPAVKILLATCAADPHFPRFSQPMLMGAACQKPHGLLRPHH